MPADRPRLAIAVVLDDPLGGTHAGGSVAAPVFRRVGAMALRYLGVTPRGTVPVKLSDISARTKDADPLAAAVETSTVAKGTESPAATEMPVVSVKRGDTRLPDFSGLPQREAVRTVLSLGLSPRVEGTGRLARQEPAAGSVLPRGSTVKLVFVPPS